MGCCHSRAIRSTKTKDARKSQDEFPGIVHQRRVLEKESEKASGVRVRVTSAGWMADSNFRDYVQMVDGGDEMVFASLFDPHESHHAAQFCAERCHGVFLKAMKQSNANPQRALELTFEQLDQQFLSSSLSPSVRAMSGCSGVIAYVDKIQRKCWIANVGTCQCLIGVSEGAFNAKSMDGRAIVPRHHTENSTEQEWLMERFPKECGSPLQRTDGRTLTKGVSSMTRCIGCGFAKDAKLARVYNKTAKKPIEPLPTPRNPYISSKPQVETYELSAGVENLILYSEGMGDLLSPSEMAIFAMHFDDIHRDQLERNHISGSTQALNPLQCQAAALIQHAVAKAAENLAMTTSSFRKSPNKRNQDLRRKDELLNVDHVKRLRINQKGSKHSQKNMTRSFCRSDVHGNLACIIISFESKSKSHTISSPGGRSSPRSSAAVYRWKLVQLYCRFLIQRRRTCLRHWWQLVSMAIKEAERQLLEFEKAEWLREQEANGLANGFGIAHVYVQNDNPMKNKRKTKEHDSPYRPQTQLWIS